ncbi:hypothetical protein BS50DRAFT_601474 [Corynespora cassiicola Philippines]|uniref:Uncharacterized protein n=1 Tax=Corynespora cassiicola Philippines TaxID=1448308 RepID=A0A2T2NHS7_CORCC|nr:hypothetical protein BS50DRAFT_601474 [Corynespora cassiicola Philippines]
MAATCHFLRLPLELREEIYSLYLQPETKEGEFGGGQYHFDLDLYRVNRQLYYEAQTVFRREHVFVRIETPWPTAAWINAVNHISAEGLVPIVAAGPRASKFTSHHALVQITAPVHQTIPEHTMVILLPDLHLFCRVWYYSALNYPALNEHLRVGFVLRDPYYPASPRAIPCALQKQILLPFGCVKGLFQVDVEGFEPGVRAELERQMAVPNDTLAQCCEKGFAIMERGDALLADRLPAEALAVYIDAFHAIHILISGRTRRVQADHFFHDEITEGKFAGQTGATVRIVLRIKLVARVCAAYIQLAQWEEAVYWGMRSIKIMREAMDTEFEDFLSDWVGASDVGHIYLRTAIAFQKMEDAGSGELAEYKETAADVAGSARLFSLAVKYTRGAVSSGQASSGSAS